MTTEPVPSVDGYDSRGADAPAYRAAIAAAFGAMVDPVVLLDDGGCIVDANSRALLALGATLAQLQSVSLFSIVPAGGVAELPLRLGAGESLTVPARLAAPIGGTTSIELHLTRLALAGPPRFLCVLRPLSALGFTLYSQLATLLDQAPWICFQKDAAGRYEYINRRYAEVFGVSQRSVVGRTDADLFSPEVVKPLRDNDRLVAEFGRVLVTEEAVPQSDGLHFFLAYKFPIRDAAGRITSTAGIAADITEGRRHRAALHEAALQGQNRFSRELHDGVGQELATLSLFGARLIREFGNDNPALARDLRELLDGIARVGQSSRDIARGLSPIGDTETGLRIALRELMERFACAMDVPRVLFSEDHSASLQIPLEATNHLYRIAQEAVSNAIRHSGGTQVMLSFHVDRDLARLTVTDDGRGAAPRESDGMGLHTMQRRAAEIGSRLAIHAATPDGGTSVICEIGNRSTVPGDASLGARPVGRGMGV